jgi:hypothetical protein
LLAVYLSLSPLKKKPKINMLKKKKARMRWSKESTDLEKSTEIS